MSDDAAQQAGAATAPPAQPKKPARRSRPRKKKPPAEPAPAQPPGAAEPPAGAPAPPPKPADAPSKQPNPNTLVIHPGSRTLRVGKPADAQPRTEVDTEAEEEEEEADSPARQLREWRAEAARVHGELEARQAATLERLAAEAQTRLQPTKDVMEFNEANCAAPLSGADAAWTDTSSQPPFVFGEAACRLAPGEPYDVVFPFEGGRFFSREDASIAEQRARAARILLHVIESELKIARQELGTYTAALVVPDYWSVRDLAEYVGVLFAEVGFQDVFLHKESVLACYGTGAFTACVVDLGAAKTTVCCVQDGVIAPGSTQVIDFGGDDMDRLLAWLLPRCERFVPKAATPAAAASKHRYWAEIARLKETLCTLATPIAATNFALRDPQLAPSPSFALSFSVGITRELAPLALFEPHLRSAPSPAGFYGRSVAFVREDPSAVDPLADLFLHETIYHAFAGAAPFAGARRDAAGAAGASSKKKKKKRKRPRPKKKAPDPAEAETEAEVPQAQEQMQQQEQEVAPETDAAARVVSSVGAAGGEEEAEDDGEDDGEEAVIEHDETAPPPAKRAALIAAAMEDAASAAVRAGSEPPSDATLRSAPRGDEEDEVEEEDVALPHQSGAMVDESAPAASLEDADAAAAAAAAAAATEPMAEPQAEFVPPPALAPYAELVAPAYRSVQEAVALAVAKADAESQAAAKKHILLVGGGARLQGLAANLETRVAAAISAAAGDVAVVREARGGDPRLLSWRGLALVVQEAGHRAMTLTRVTWQLQGVRAIRECAPFAL